MNSTGEIFDPQHTDGVVVNAGYPLRLAALTIDLFAIVIGSYLFLVIAIVLYMGLSGDDFDGPPSYSATEDWFLLSCITFGGVALSMLDLLNGRTPGKAILKLEIQLNSLACAPMRSFMARWAVKYAPLISLFFLAFVGYVVMESNRHDFEMERMTPYNASMWRVTKMVPPLLLLIQMIYFVIRQRTMHDDIAGTRLCRRVASDPHRGFEPILRK